MMQINKIEIMVKILLSKYKIRTKALACSILDVDGFILWTENEIFDDIKYERFLISLYTYVEYLIGQSKNMGLNGKTKVMSITYSQKKGSSFLIRAIDDYLYLISINPLLLDESSCISEFDNVCDEIESLLRRNEKDSSLLTNSVIKATKSIIS